MKTFRVPTQEQAGALLGMMAVLFGGWVRLVIPWTAGFPVNDGGLFYVMLRDLQANGLRLPPYVQYNGLRIPFAYPPLGFYVGVITADVFRVDPIKVLQWLPAVVMIGTLPAFYLLAKSVLSSSFSAGLATLVYALTPHAISWQIMGGGLTRAFGQLFLIIALAFICRTFTGYSLKNLLLAILCSSLVVLSHPEAALHTVGLALVLWLVKGRSKQASIHALEIGLGTLLLTAVWWLPAILSYGLETLLSAARTGQYNLLFLFVPFLFSFVDEPLLSLIAVFGLIGVGVELARRRVLLPLWFFVPFLVEPRNASTVVMVPLAMLAASALTEAILPGVAGLASAAQPGTNLMRSSSASIFLIFITVYMLGNASYYALQMAGTVVSRPAREAFAWIRQNTPAGSRFLVLTGNTEQQPFCDPPLEWFPALAERISLTTVQGREWTQGDQFGRISADAQNVAACLGAKAPLQCLEGVQSSHPEIGNIDYFYVARTSPVLANCRTVGASSIGERLIAELQASPVYLQVFDNDAAVVFKRR